MGLFSSIGNWVSGAANKVGGALSGAANKVGSFVKDNGNKILDGISYIPIVGNITDGTRDLVNAFGSHSNKPWDYIKGFGNIGLGAIGIGGIAKAAKAGKAAGLGGAALARVIAKKALLP